MAADYVFKIILVGETGVGKSCLLCRYADDTYTENYMSTIGVDFKIRTINLNGKTIKLNIWDSAGQERFRTIVNTYYRGAHGVCVVYDITDTHSFERVADWLTDVSKQASPTAKRLLIGSKLDMASQRQVKVADVRSYADSLGIPFIETSSKSGENVEEAFLQMTKLMMLDVADTEYLIDSNDAGGFSIGSGQSIGGAMKKGCC